MDNSNLTVNALWIGSYLFPNELMTIKSFLNNGHKFNLWVYNKIETPLPQGLTLKDANEILNEKYIFSYKYHNQFGHGKGSFAGFSDIFRYKLLYMYGGWWTDMDVTCLKPLDFDEEYVFRTHQSLPLVGNIMKCPKGSLLMKNCFEEAILKVNADNRDWHLPIKILVDGVMSLGLDKYVKNYSNEDSWNVVRVFLLNSVEVPDNWRVIHWINEEWRRNKINKKCFFKNSLFAKLALENNVDIEYPSNLQKCEMLFKLSKLGYVYRIGFDIIAKKERDFI